MERKALCTQNEDSIHHDSSTTGGALKKWYEPIIINEKRLQNSIHYTTPFLNVP